MPAPPPVSSLFLSPDEIFMPIHTGSVAAAGATGVNAFKDSEASELTERERERDGGDGGGREGVGGKREEQVREKNRKISCDRVRKEEREHE